jgi:CheY-like chemotaxis protein
MPSTADIARLNVLIELFSECNAALYTEERGHIGVLARRDGDTVVLTVSDDGIGIASDALSSVFEPFVQGASTTHGWAGLGLGLAVVKQLTELHGGSVTVASEGSGRGTKFTVRLPVLAAGSVATDVRASSFLVAHAETSRRVLLVDDNEDALDLLSTLVETSGHEVVVAHDGAEALAVFERFRPSVAVIDISMPRMDGCEVAARIRAQAVGKGYPYLVALTGYGQAGDRERTRRAGFDEHLVKPVALESLLRAIARGSGDSVRAVG